MQGQLEFPPRVYERPTRLAPERSTGIALVDLHAPRDWRDAFDQVARLAQRGTPFCVYDVLETVGKPDAHPAAIGARMQANARRGVIVKVGTAEPVAHGDLVTLWQGR